ncbi:Hypothetical predicted protein [Olea europaea subsp. europaea]|uniref:Uncharacterized protein n=1 Tax=Olea europaea subsp. europaea TaxID=158383 RepID=A0A8S0T4C0_OLEEU|nr:Hypothetical predicted protein [Olea europaea subsp. europaea]
MEETGNMSTNNGRSSHNVGRLGNLIQCPHVFEEDVFDNIKGWVMDESPGTSVEDHNWKHESRKRKTLDSEMLCTYSTGLLATSIGQKDANSLIEHRSAVSVICAKSREEIRGRLRQVLDSSHMDVLRVQDDEPLNGPEWDHARSRAQAGGDERWVNDYEVEANGKKILMKTREMILPDADAKKGLGKNNADPFVLERDDDDDCFKDCKVGSKDIADVFKKAVRAAEARAANAPAEAIKAAGDVAAEVVKSFALEEFKKTNSDEAAMMAASRAALTVIDAANAVAISRGSSTMDDDSGNSKPTEPEPIEDIGEFFILDNESLRKLKEKFCIQCLVILGEYVEVLGPVLHEKGVDVCLTLLQRSFKHKDASSSALLLPNILKLICALAAHWKFAALFVDRGGMQKLLPVPRVARTFFGLSSCLFTIGSIQGIMERVCALSSNVVHQVVEWLFNFWSALRIRLGEMLLYSLLLLLSSEQLLLHSMHRMVCRNPIFCTLPPQ